MTRSLTLFMLVGCAPGLFPACSDEPEPPITDDTGDCYLSIDEVWPADGAVDAYYRSDIEWELSDPDTEMTPIFTVWAGSTEVAGDTWLSGDEETVYFTPAEPFEPVTAHTVVLTTCRGEAETAFTTSELGLPLEVDIVGKTWSVDLEQGRVVKPEGVGDIIFELGVPPVLVEVQEADGSLELMGALALDDGTQDPCSPTIPFPSADFSEEPFFQVPASLVTLEVMDVVLPVHEFVLKGTVAPDGSWFGGAVIGGELDARDIVDVIDEVDTPEDLCNLTASFGAPCQPCSSDGEEYCLEVLVDRLIGEEVDLDLVEITEPDCED